MWEWLKEKTSSCKTVKNHVLDLLSNNKQTQVIKGEYTTVYTPIKAPSIIYTPQKICIKYITENVSSIKYTSPKSISINYIPPTNHNLTPTCKK